MESQVQLTAGLVYLSYIFNLILRARENGPWGG